MFQSFFLQPQKHTDWQTAAPCFHFEAREEECQYGGSWLCTDSSGQIRAWTSRLSFERRTCFATQPYLVVPEKKHESDYRFLQNRQLSCLQLKQAQKCVSVKVSVKDDLSATTSLSALLLFDLSLSFDSDLACWLYVQERFPRMC